MFLFHDIWPNCSWLVLSGNVFGLVYSLGKMVKRFIVVLPGECEQGDGEMVTRTDTLALVGKDNIEYVLRNIVINT